MGDPARARHEATLRELFFDLTLDMLCVADARGYFLELNPAWSVLGWSFDELKARPFLELVHPDDVAPTLEIMERLTSSDFRTISFENRYRCKDGTYRWLLWSSRTSWTPENPDDPLYYAVARDITERKAQEALLREQAERLARSNADLEQFAHIASHDLQEPLRMVSSYVQLLEKRYKGQLDEQADRYIRYAVDGAQRMHALINDLLAYSRVSSHGLSLQPVSAGSVVGRMLDDMQASLTERGAVVTAGALPRVMADAGQLRQLFQNLVGNAVKFVRTDVPPRVDIRAVADGDRWMFSVSDNGIGIDPANHQRIFELFQRLHGRGEYPGTGLGLAIAKKIVERHGGEIWLESRPAEGTTFHFTLRRAEE